MKLPYQEFEDQRSGETLSILAKVRTDTERFMNYMINVLFSVAVGVLFRMYLCRHLIHWTVPLAYFVGIVLLTLITTC